jgi:hypothetical protein
MIIFFKLFLSRPFFKYFNEYFLKNNPKSRWVRFMSSHLHPHINVDVLLMDYGCVRSEYGFVGFFWICEIDVV